MYRYPFVSLLVIFPVVCSLQEGETCFASAATSSNSKEGSSHNNNATTTTTTTTTSTSTSTTTTRYPKVCTADFNRYGAFHSSCPDSSCPMDIYNSKLNSNNVVEIFDLNPNIIAQIRQGYEEDVEPNLGYSTEDICYVDPYHPDKAVWSGYADVTYRSNAKWYSMRSLDSYNKYAKYIEELGILDYFQGTWIDAPKVTIYGMFFLKRNHSEAHHMHWDWQYEINTQLITFLLPVKDVEVGLAYKDVNDQMHHYNYEDGKGIGFAGGFMHSTDVGHSETDNVLMSIYLGGDDLDVYELWQASSSDELENHMHPINGWVRNPMNVDAPFCLPKYGEDPKSRVKTYSRGGGFTSWQRQDVQETIKRNVFGGSNQHRPAAAATAKTNTSNGGDRYELGNVALDMTIEQLAMMIMTLKNSNEKDQSSNNNDDIETIAIQKLQNAIHRYKKKGG